MIKDCYVHVNILHSGLFFVAINNNYYFKVQKPVNTESEKQGRQKVLCG